MQIDIFKKNANREASHGLHFHEIVNPFMQNVAKWPNILQKSCDAHTARFFKYIWQSILQHT